MKYTKKQKLEWIHQYLSGMPLKYPPGIRSKKRFNDMVSRWSKYVDIHGESILEHGKHKHFSTEQKLDAIQHAGQDGYEAVAIRLGISSSVVTNWVRTYSEAGLDGLKSLGKNRGRPPKMKPEKTTSPKPVLNETKDEKIARLERELLEERAENALLKKVQALMEEKKAKGLGK